MTAVAGYNEKHHFEATFDLIAKEILDDIAQFNLPANGQEWLKKVRSVCMGLFYFEDCLGYHYLTIHGRFGF
jgi:uncharacterized membrane protein